MNRPGARRALRFLAALAGAFAAFYLLVLLAAPLLLDAVAWTTTVFLDPIWEHAVALLGASVGATVYAIRDARRRRSLERLWTFVIGSHLFTYLLMIPFFRVVDVGDTTASVLAVPVGRVLYYSVGSALFLAALLAAYGVVYGRGFEALSTRLKA